MEEGSHYCGSSCLKAAQQRAPLLLEAPRGHIVFREIASHFNDCWTHKMPHPEVKKVYRIIQQGSYLTEYEDYRTRVRNEVSQWHGTVRECTIGNGGIVTPCTQDGCTLCRILRSTPHTSLYPDGMIHTSFTTDKSDFYSKSPKHCSYKAMLLTNVVAGKSVKLTRSELMQGIPAGYNSAQVGDSHRASTVDGLVVTTGQAVQPSHLVIYE